jgi:glycosyltransferase involved in cell wall biosynthesis
MCLESIQKQTCSDFEVIVVSDGPDQRTDDLMLQADWEFERQYFTIPKSQQGIARNRAVERARGEICLLIGDDMLLMPDVVQKHIDTHAMLAEKNQELGIKKHDAAVLGFTSWDPTIEITPTMRWMEESGVQFGYPKIEQYAHDVIPPDLQQWFTYTSHISLPTRALWKHRFREDVSLYGWEDMEWGKRLMEANIPLYYQPDAKALHHHAFTNAEVWERSKLLGTSARVIEELVPDLHVIPRGWKKWGHRMESFLPTKKGRHWRAFFRGLKA